MLFKTWVSEVCGVVSVELTSKINTPSLTEDWIETYYYFNPELRLYPLNFSEIIGTSVHHLKNIFKTLSIFVNLKKR